MTARRFWGLMLIRSASRSAQDGVLRLSCTTLDEALRILKNAVPQEGKYFGRAGGQLRVIFSRELARTRRGAGTFLPIQTFGARSAEMDNVPNGRRSTAALRAALARSEGLSERSLDAMAKHVEGMLRAAEDGLVTFDYGKQYRTFAFQRWG